MLIPTTVNAKDFVFNGNHAFKSYMDYRKITCTASKQYSMQRESQTLSNGIRVKDNCYCVAIGTAFNCGVGEKINVYLDNGKMLPCIVGDIKRDCDTDETNTYVPINGNVVEFIVDTNILNDVARAKGDISYVPEFAGNVIRIKTPYDNEHMLANNESNLIISEVVYADSLNCNIYSQEDIDKQAGSELKKNYPTGTRIALDDIKATIPDNIKVGDKGTITEIDSDGTIFVKWDTGDEFGLNYNKFRFHEISI